MRQLFNQIRTWMPQSIWGVTIVCGAVSCYFSLRSGFCADDFLILWDSRGPFWELVRSHITAPDLFSVAYYRPLQRLVHLIEFKVFGSSALLYHAVSILIHLSNAVLAHRLFLKMGAPTRVAGIAAVVFATHPAQTEPVTFISALSGVIAATCLLAAMNLYLRFLDTGSLQTGGGVLLTVTLALLSKEDAVSAPITLGIVWIFISRARRRLWPVLATVPLVVVWLLWRWEIGGALDPGGNGFSTNPLTIVRNLPFHVVRFLVSVRSIFRLTDFENYYALRDALLPTPHGAVYIVAVLAIALVTGVWVWRQWHKWPDYVKCGLGIGISGLLLYLPLRESATRFLYFPSVGLSVAAVGIIVARDTRWRRGILYAWIVVLAVSTVEQTSTWYQAGRRVDSVLQEAVKVRQQHPPGVGTVFIDFPRRHYAALVFPIGLEYAIRWRTKTDWPYIYVMRDLPRNPAVLPDSMLWYRWADDRFVPAKPSNP
ncbi:MAG: hypothetical protein Kow0074_15300 [Candidatus Zixiibacteriota bacterium]